MKTIRRDSKGKFKNRWCGWWNKNGWKFFGLIVLMQIIGYVGVTNYQQIKQDLQTPIVVKVQAEETSVQQLPNGVKETLNYYAELYGVSKDLVSKIVKCESNFNPDVTGDYQAGLVSHGLWQFQLDTFAQYARVYKVKNADINSYQDQTVVAIQMLRDGLRNKWTCGR